MCRLCLNYHMKAIFSFIFNKKNRYQFQTISNNSFIYFVLSFNRVNIISEYSSIVDLNDDNNTVILQYLS